MDKCPALSATLPGDCLGEGTTNLERTDALFCHVWKLKLITVLFNDCMGFRSAVS